METAYAAAPGANVAGPEAPLCLSVPLYDHRTGCARARKSIRRQLPAVVCGRMTVLYEARESRRPKQLSNSLPRALALGLSGRVG